jgi:(methylthio)acryloyl-CoA hydratase
VALGFSQYLVERGQGLTRAIELAERIATNAPLSNYAVLQALPRIARADPDVGFLLESLMSAVAVADDEAKLRLRAFLEKRAEKVSHG